MLNYIANQSERFRLQLFGWWVLAFAGMSFTATPGEVRADVVYLRHADEPLFGEVLEQSEHALLFRHHLQDGRSVDRTMQRDEILAVVVTYDAAELEALSPENPRGYLQVADRLFLARRDPMAKELAQRLYLIAARFGDSTIRESSFRALVELEDQPAQRRRIQAFAFAVDPEGSQAWLNLDSNRSPAADQAQTQDAARWLLHSIQAIRRGQVVDVDRLLVEPQVRALLEQMHDEGPDKLRALGSALQISPGDMHWLIQMELHLSARYLRRSGVSQEEPIQPHSGIGAGVPGELGDSVSPWAQAERLQVPVPPIPTWRTLIPGVDPSYALFRNGRWDPIIPTPD